jgi:hypothetical protein
MAFNFTDDLGFDESAGSPNDFVTLFPMNPTAQTSNVALSGKIKFTSEGVYAETDAGTNYSQSIVFWPWSAIAHIQQGR